VFPNEYKRALAEMSAKSKPPVETKAAQEAGATIAKAKAKDGKAVSTK